MLNPVKKGIKKKMLLVFVLLSSPFLIIVNKVMDVKSVPVSSQNPILFVHGWTGDARAWITIQERFSNDGWSSDILKAYSFISSNEYTSAANILNAEYINIWVDDILNKTGAEKVDIVAHSMGGYSSRYYIKFLGGLNKIDDFVSMGSPHHGTYGGTQVFHSNSSFLYSLNEGDETPGGILNDTIGFRIDIIGGRIYNGTHIPGDINYTSIYSTADVYAYPYNTSILDGANNIQVEDISHIAGMLNDEVFYNLIKNAVYDYNSGGNDNSSIPGYNLLIFLGFVSLLVITIIKKQKIK
jgi:triacylglycerol lipase